jgi:tetratricopeptide (TPR) repeat protein
MRFARKFLLPAFPLALIAGCFPERPEVREAKLQRLAASAIESEDHCAAADALLHLASHYESLGRYRNALEAAQRGIDVWEPAETFAFLIRERERARAAGFQDSAKEFDRKIEEGKSRLKLWIPPKEDDSPCHLRPPSVNLVEARLIAARVALRASRLPEARGHLDELRRALSAHKPVYATAEQEQELHRLEALYQNAIDAA